MVAKVKKIGVSTRGRLNEFLMKIKVKYFDLPPRGADLQTRGIGTATTQRKIQTLQSTSKELKTSFRHREGAAK